MSNPFNQSGISVDPNSIREGDRSAFLALYNEFHIKVFRFFLKRIHVVEDARDLTQQTFIRVWQFRHTISSAYPISKQLFIIAHSQLINHLDKEVARGRLLKKQADRPLQEADHLNQLELSDQLTVAINSLPPTRKRVLILKTVHDHSNKEIAQMMKISVKTVENHITHAFQRMKQIMTLLMLIAQLFIIRMF